MARGLGIALRIALLATAVFCGLIAAMAAFTRAELQLMTASSLIARGGALLGVLQQAADAMPLDAFVQAHGDHVVREPETALERAALATREVQDAMSDDHRYTVVRPIALRDSEGRPVMLALRVTVDGTYDVDYLAERVQHVLLV